MRKKAQTEILGVLLVVILLVIGGVYFVTQSMKPSSTDTETYTDPEVAQSLLNSLMNTKTEKNVIVSDIIKECYTNRNDLCGQAPDACCAYAHDTMKNAIEMTLVKWKKPYRLTVKRAGSDDKIAEISVPECSDDSEKAQPGTYFIPPYPQVTVTLEICK